MTTVSILCPQNRPGGLDVLFSGLALQTYRDFELILIDDLRAFRGHLVHDYAKQYGLNVTHVGPYQVPTLPCGLYEPGHYQRALNTGLTHARGSVVLTLADYTYLTPRSVEVHASYHTTLKQNGKYCLIGGLDCADVKPHMHPDFPLRYGWYAMGHDPALYTDATFAESYQPWMNPVRRIELGNEWRANYEADLESGALDAFMWSTFAEPVTPETDISKFRVWHSGHKDVPNGKVHSQLCNLKNNSFATDSLLAVQGWDEAFDGCHGHQDSELAGRLESKLGLEFWLYHETRAILLEPHGIAIIRGYTKHEDNNLHMYNQKWNTGVWDGGAGFDLAGRRKDLNDSRPL